MIWFCIVLQFDQWKPQEAVQLKISDDTFEDILQEDVNVESNIPNPKHSIQKQHEPVTRKRKPKKYRHVDYMEKKEEKTPSSER